MTDTPPEIRLYGRSLVRWAEELARRTDSETAGRLLTAAATTVLVATHGAKGAAEFFRELADQLDTDRPKPN